MNKSAKHGLLILLVTIINLPGKLKNILTFVVYQGIHDKSRTCSRENIVMKNCLLLSSCFGLHHCLVHFSSAFCRLL